MEFLVYSYYVLIFFLFFCHTSITFLPFSFPPAIIPSRPFHPRSASQPCLLAPSLPHCVLSRPGISLLFDELPRHGFKLLKMMMMIILMIGEMMMFILLMSQNDDH